jgi:hypothetical protein
MKPQQLKAMKLALEALELLTDTEQTFGALDYGDNAITAIKEVLAEHAMQEVQRLGQEIEQAPVAHLWECIGRWSVYLVHNGKQADCAPPSWLVDAVNNATTPPQRTWVGLTKEQIAEFDAWHDNRDEEVGWVNPSEIVAYIDAKLKEKNT